VAEPVPDRAPAPATTTEVLVRFFAGAAAAAGREEQRVVLPGPATVGALLDTLAADHGPVLQRVLAASSFLLDAVSTDRAATLGDGATLDVLPPFAGG
jgi:molybdopterin synthase sulfur carrier subunit